MRVTTRIALLLVVIAAGINVNAQTPTPAPLTAAEQAARDATRERLRTLLNSTGPGINVTFKQSEKQPYNFTGTMTTGLAHVDSFEIVVGVSLLNTMAFRVYPHYKGGYINVDKARDPIGLSRLLLRLSDRAFLFWGVDEAYDVFTGFNFTLESGFPEDSLKMVLRSIHNSENFMGEMRPFIDGSVAK